MLGILSDAHGNHAAFDQAIDVLKSLGAEEIVFLGDAVGYIPSPAVVTKLQATANLRFCTRGNHEDMLLNKNVSPERDAVYQLGLTSRLLSEADIGFLSSWPSSQQIECEVGKLLFIHGSPHDHIYGYVYPDTQLSDLKTEADFVFMGNTHRPFQRTNGGTTYVNVGSCGLPRDDGRFGSAAIFDPMTGVSKIIRFDISESTRETLSATTGIHSSVTELFSRRSDTIEGQLV